MEYEIIPKHPQTSVVAKSASSQTSAHIHAHPPYHSKSNPGSYAPTIHLLSPLTIFSPTQHEGKAIRSNVHDVFFGCRRTGRPPASSCRCLPPSSSERRQHFEASASAYFVFSRYRRTTSLSFSNQKIVISRSCVSGIKY